MSLLATAGRMPLDARAAATGAASPARPLSSTPSAQADSAAGFLAVLQSLTSAPAPTVTPTPTPTANALPTETGELDQLMSELEGARNQEAVDSLAGESGAGEPGAGELGAGERDDSPASAVISPLVTTPPVLVPVPATSVPELVLPSIPAEASQHAAESVTTGVPAEESSDGAESAAPPETARGVDRPPALPPFTAAEAPTPTPSPTPTATQSLSLSGPLTAPSLSPSPVTEISTSATPAPLAATEAASSPVLSAPIPSAPIPSAPIPLASAAVTAPAAALPSAAPPAVVQALPVVTAQLRTPLISLASAAPGEHTMTIALAPDDLGPIVVRAQISSEGMRVEMFAANDSGREAIRAILADLRRDLAGAGLSAGLDLSENGTPDPEHRRAIPHPDAPVTDAAADLDRDLVRSTPVPTAFSTTSTIDTFA